MAPAAAQQKSTADDEVVKAMRDELSRSMKKLQMENLEKPYFIAYSVVDSNSAYVQANFGSVTGKASEQRWRSARIQVRVGDYQFDNRNFYSNSGGSGLVSFRNGWVILPADDQYDEIRRQLWLATDSVYKKAVQDISRKRAVLANKNRTDAVPDFSKEEPVSLSDVRPAVAINIPDMENEVRQLSAVFKRFPQISTSSVSLRIINEYSRYLNSEGTFTTSRLPEVELFVRSGSQATDGQPLSAGIAWRGRAMSELPPVAEIAKKIELRCSQVGELRAAPLPEHYAGPILFEGDAAAEVLWDRFVPHLLAIPEILADGPQNESRVPRDDQNLVDKIGLRALPDFLNLADDPTISMLGSMRLFGMQKLDDEGVPSRRIQIVENGILKNLLTSRAPVRGFPHSTGSFHSGGITPSNVIMASSKSLPLEELRAELLRRAKLRGRDYGVIVRKVDFGTRGGDNGGLPPGSMPVLLAYKRFPDGHEELMRNAIINGISFGSFKDILAVSDTPAVWTAFFSPRGFSPSESAGSTLVSLAIPALLFEDATVQKPTGTVKKPPILGHPYFTKK
jgi:hypothetical protein